MDVISALGPSVLLSDTVDPEGSDPAFFGVCMKVLEEHNRFTNVTHRFLCEVSTCDDVHSCVM